MNLIHIEQDAIVKIILTSGHEPIEEIYIFGSYATGREIRSSDLDIMVRAKEKLSATEFVSIEQRLEDSNVTHIVDLVDYHNVDIDIREAMLENAVTIYRRPLV